MTALVVLLLTLAALQPAVPQDQFFDSNGVRIRYIEQGQGPAVVLIHGYTGNAERHWLNSGVFADLARDHRVIAVDCRGHGKSGKPTDPKAYGAEMAQDVVRLLDHLKIPRAHIVGYSMGAIIAGKLLTVNPERFLTASFVAHHAVHAWSAKDDDEAEASAKELEGDTPFKSLFLAFVPAGAPVPSDAEITERLAPMIAVNDVKALAAYNRSRRALVVTNAQLAAITVPTLGIIGSADPSAAAMRELKPLMPSLDLIVVDGAEHGGERGILRRPEFLPALRQHFARAR